MNRVLLRLLLVGAIGTVAAPGHAHAQSAPGPVDKKQVAKQYVDAGLAAQESGDYETAITFYLKAYQLVPHPTLLFNMAQAHRLAGHVDQALALYRRYLAEDPSGAQARFARELVSEIEARKAEPMRTADEARDAPGNQVAVAALTDPAAGPPGDLRDAASEAPPQPGRLPRIAGLAIGAGGAVAVGIGIGFGLHARSLSDDLSRQGAVYDPAKVRAGERANGIAIVGMAGGAALIATGVALYWWGYTQGRAAESVALAPLVLPRAAGLVISGALP